ncbi:MAG: hypothetical protein KAS54_06835 [Dehalococcoidia bacterium]|nr:hypothetical protein [Dehalococcoidia bacterium]
MWLIPILVLGYIGWVNLLPFGSTFTYLIDIGGDDTGGKARITGPLDRISDKMMANGTSFRELEHMLVYFELDSRRVGDAAEVEVKVRFEDNLPSDRKFMLGARDEAEWSYYWKDIYVPFYGQLTDFSLVAEDGSIKVYATGEGSDFSFESVDEFLQNPPVGSVIARNDKGLSINQGCEVVDLKYDLSWVRENADYVIVDYADYMAPSQDDGWLIAQASWKREDLFIKDDKLSFCFNVPHLSGTEGQGKPVPIDWIEISLKIPHIWERLGD